MVSGQLGPACSSQTSPSVSQIVFLTIQGGLHFSHVCSPQPRHSTPSSSSQQLSAAEQQQRKAAAEEAKARRTLQGAAMLFQKDAQTLQDNYCLTFDYRIASMVNRALWELTQPLIAPQVSRTEDVVLKNIKNEELNIPASVANVAQTTANQIHVLVNGPQSNLAPLPDFISQNASMIGHPALSLTNPATAPQKPSISMVNMIKEAIMASKTGHLTAVELFEAIEERYP